MKRSFSLFCALSILTLAACGSSSSTPAAGGAAGGSTGGPAGSTGSPGGSTGSPGGSTGSPGGSTGTTAFTRVDVTDDIGVATTWYATNVYVIPDGATVYVNAGLTIQAGTVVKLGADSELSISSGGQINATGTSIYPIVFTSLKDDGAGGDTNADGAFSSPGMGDWYGVTVSGNQSTFSSCQFLYGTYGLQLSAKNLTVSNNTFYMNTTALDASQAGSTGVSIVGNTFYANTHAVLANSNYAVDSTNVFHYKTFGGNTFQAIEVSGDIQTTTVWNNTEVAYTFNDSDATTYVNAALTLAPGVVVKFAQGDSFAVMAPGVVNGMTAADFTSLSDDTLLGDSNGDGSATSPGQGDWDGVSLIPTTGPTTYYDGLNVFYAAN